MKSWTDRSLTVTDGSRANCSSMQPRTDAEAMREKRHHIWTSTLFLTFYFYTSHCSLKTIRPSGQSNLPSHYVTFFYCVLWDHFLRHSSLFFFCVPCVLNDCIVVRWFISSERVSKGPEFWVGVSFSAVERLCLADVQLLSVLLLVKADLSQRQKHTQRQNKIKEGCVCKLCWDSALLLLLCRSVATAQSSRPHQMWRSATGPERPVSVSLSLSQWSYRLY